MDHFSERQSSDYYRLLQVDRNADVETIKRAYRKMALKYHPDRAGSSQFNTEKFQNIQKAYSVLSDSKLRKIYEQYGERGILMAQSMSQHGSILDPEILLSINRFFLFCTLLVTLLIVYFAFLSAKTENKLNWPWSAIFTPIFLIDAAILFSIISHKKHYEELDQDEHEDESKKPIKIISAAYIFLHAIFHIMIALKLDNLTSATWSEVFIPWYVIECFHLYVIFPSVYARLNEKVYDSSDDTEILNGRKRNRKEQLKLIWTEFSFFILRILQVLLLILKLEGVAISWGLVFLPIWLWGFEKAISLILQSAAFKNYTDEEKQMFISQFIGFVLSAIFVFTSFGLLVKKLASSDASPSTATILIPLFIILSTLFCCSCCCGPLLIAAARKDLHDQLSRNIIPLERRINETA